MPDEFPSFDVPSDVTGSTPSSVTPAAEPQQPSAPAPPADTDIPEASNPLFAPMTAQGDTPAADTTPARVPRPTQTPAAPAVAPSAEALLLAQQSQLLASIAARLQPQAPEAEPPPPRDPKDIALEQTLIKRIPTLGPLLAALNDPVKAQALQALLTAAPQHQQTVAAFYEQYADATVDKLKGIYATDYGVDATALNREDENLLSDQFQMWVTQPQNAKALQRYEAGDLRVVDEFGQFFRSRFVQPARRAGQQAVAQRGQVVAGLPRGGGSQIPTPSQTAPRVQTPASERDVFGEAWGELQRSRAGA